MRQCIYLRKHWDGEAKRMQRTMFRGCRTREQFIASGWADKSFRVLVPQAKSHARSSLPVWRFPFPIQCALWPTAAREKKRRWMKHEMPSIPAACSSILLLRFPNPSPVSGDFATGFARSRCQCCPFFIVKLQMGACFNLFGSRHGRLGWVRVQIQSPGERKRKLLDSFELWWMTGLDVPTWDECSFL